MLQNIAWRSNKDTSNVRVSVTICYFLHNLLLPEGDVSWKSSRGLNMVSNLTLCLRRCHKTPQYSWTIFKEVFSFDDKRPKDSFWNWFEWIDAILQIYIQRPLHRRLYKYKYRCLKTLTKRYRQTKLTYRTDQRNTLGHSILYLTLAMIALGPLMFEGDSEVGSHEPLQGCNCNKYYI